MVAYNKYFSGEIFFNEYISYLGLDKEKKGGIFGVLRTVTLSRAGYFGDVVTMLDIPYVWLFTRPTVKRRKSTSTIETASPKYPDPGYEPDVQFRDFAARIGHRHKRHVERSLSPLVDLFSELEAETVPEISLGDCSAGKLMRYLESDRLCGGNRAREGERCHQNQRPDEEPAGSNSNNKSPFVQIDFTKQYV